MICPNCNIECPMHEDARLTALEEAMLHLLEVQTAPSFHDGEDKALYAKQSEEWRAAVNEARRVLRESK